MIYIYQFCEIVTRVDTAKLRFLTVVTTVSTNVIINHQGLL